MTLVLKFVHLDQYQGPQLHGALGALVTQPFFSPGSSGVSALNLGLESPIIPPERSQSQRYTDEKPKKKCHKIMYFMLL